MRGMSHVMVVLSSVVIMIVIFGLVLSQSISYSVDFYDDSYVVASYTINRVDKIGIKILDSAFVRLFRTLGNTEMHKNNLIATPYCTDYLDWYDEVGFKALWRFTPNYKNWCWQIFNENDVAAKTYGGTAYNFSFVIKEHGNGVGNNFDFSGIRSAFRGSRISYADYYGYPDLSGFDSVANTSRGSPCICYYLTSRFIYFFDVKDFKYHLFSPNVYVKCIGNKFDTNAIILEKDGVYYTPFVPTAEIFMKYKLYEDYAAGLLAYFSDEDMLDKYDPTVYIEMTFLPEVYEYHHYDVINYNEVNTPVPFPCDHEHSNYLVSEDVYLTNEYYQTVLGK